jgi:PAS domain S-box-containing protein
MKKMALWLRAKLALLVCLCAAIFAGDGLAWGDPPGALLEVREEARKAFSGLEAVLASLRSEVEAKARKGIPQDLKLLLAAWESDPSARAALKERVCTQLSTLRELLQLDILVLVTQDNEVFRAERSREGSQAKGLEGEAQANLLVLAEAFFREGKVLDSIELLPTESSSSFPAEGGMRKDLYWVTSVPIWLRPDAPHSVLIGGMAAHSLGPAVEESLGRSGKKGGFDWHLLGLPKKKSPAMLAGQRLEAPFRNSFLDELLRDGVSEEPALELSDTQVGRWKLFRAQSGEVVAILGITVKQAFLRKTTAALVVADPGHWTLEGLTTHFQQHWHFYAGSCAALLALVGLIYWLLERRNRLPVRRREYPCAEDQQPASSQFLTGEELVSQFETNWKTFANYTQDLLHQKLKEMEDAPQRGVKDVQEQVGRLSEALFEVKKELGAATSDVRDSSHALLQKVAYLLEQGLEEKQERLSEAEALGQKVEARVAEEVLKLQKEWNVRVAAFSAEIEDTRKQAKGLLLELAALKETETSLRGKLEEHLAREEELQRRLDERSLQLEAMTKEREGGLCRHRELADALQSAESREKSALRRVEELEGAAKGLKASLKEEKVSQSKSLSKSAEELKSLRAELEARTKEFHEARASIEAQVKDLGQKKQEQEKALEASRAQVERLDKQVREISRAGDKHLKEAEALWKSRQGELERKVAELDRKLAESERKLAEADKASRELQDRISLAAKAAEERQESFERLRTLEVEKGDLVNTLGRVGKELETLKTEVDGVRRFQGALVDGSIPAAIVAVDTSLKAFAWNPAAEALWSRPAASVLGRFLPDLAIKGLEPEVLKQSREAILDKRSVSMPQASFTDGEGRVRHVRVSCDPILGSKGEALGGVIIANDITEQTEQEIEARLQSLFSQSLARSIPGALVVTDNRNRVISWNRAAEAILGVSEEAAVGEDFFSLKTLLAKEAFRRRFEENRKDRASHRVRVRLEARGVQGQYVITQSPFLGSDDSVRGVMIFIQEAVEPVEAGRSA